MLWHIYLTRYCNLHCSYCGADPRFETIPAEPVYTLQELVDFLKNDPNPIINFYGGEPLLRIQRLTEDIIAVKREIPNILFVLQTNGFFIKKIPKNMLSFFSSILISIDGRPEITDLYRGKGTFETVYTNVQWLVNEC